MDLSLVILAAVGVLLLLIAVPLADGVDEQRTIREHNEE